MPDDDASDFRSVVARLGPRLRALREHRGLSLAALSAMTGTSTSTLSRLESGDRQPTLALLLPLARIHQLTLDELVDAPPTGDPRLHVRAVQRAGMTVVPLSRRPGGIQAFKLLLPPGFGTGSVQLQEHEGYDWFYVLDGEPVLSLGAEQVQLRPGEVAEFDTRTPHQLANPSARPVELLALFGPQGERAMSAPDQRARVPDASRIHARLPQPPSPPARQALPLGVIMA